MSASRCLPPTHYGYAARRPDREDWFGISLKIASNQSEASFDAASSRSTSFRRSVPASPTVNAGNGQSRPLLATLEIVTQCNQRLRHSAKMSVKISDRHVVSGRDSETLYAPVESAARPGALVGSTGEAGITRFLPAPRSVCHVPRSHRAVERGRGHQGGGGGGHAHSRRVSSMPGLITTRGSEQWRSYWADASRERR